ncbi:MAG TPA: hypothetical protein VKD26_07485, partial [Streptosporangiaceae bacterium]|nr:hypothetical protein [Streptosporangiaceae bacterium]
PRYQVDETHTRVHTYTGEPAFPRRRETMRWLIRHWVTLTIVAAISAGALVAGGLALIGK